MKRVIVSIGLLLLCSPAFASDRADLTAFLASLASPPARTAAAGGKIPGNVTAFDGCPEGQIITEDGGCCIGGRQRWEKYKCINGVWEHIGNTCSGTCF